jgi:hypothetical protein
MNHIMKKSKLSYSRLVLTILLGMLLGLISCTSKFEEFNTNDVGLSKQLLYSDFNYFGGLYPSIEMTYTAERNMNQMLFNNYFVGGSFGGYVGSNAPNPRYGNYQMNMPSWDQYHIFNIGYNSIMSPIWELKRREVAKVAPDFWAIAKILKVAGMSVLVDYYGPIPYSQYGKGGTSVTYDKQEDIYNSFFTDLDSAVIVLKDYMTKNPGAKPFKSFDVMFSGDYNKWVRYANTWRLRLAMHIVKKDPAKAKLVAEKAVAEGVMTTNSDNALINGIGTYQNSLWVAALSFVNIMSNAAIVSFMNGYNDPRISKYFSKSTYPGFTDIYVGVRNGAYIQKRQTQYSNISPDFASQYSPMQVMFAAEAYFLRAEGALRGWNMGGGTAKEYYENGISTSLSQYGFSSAASGYINNTTGKPADYIDPAYPINNIPALSDIGVKWDDAASNERKLERIITQKWIAIFPDGTEAWTAFRRTGYPKLFPVQVNNSAGLISTEIQIRRQPYPLTEKNNNPTGYASGIALLKSEKGASAPGETTNTGDDTGGTRLWWDVGGPNF